MGVFHFKQFDVDDHNCGQKVCSDSVCFGAWFFKGINHASSILDIGTGSGLLALMAAQSVEKANIEAIEIDAMAAEAASRNFAASPWGERLKCTCCDLRHYIPSHTFDAISCNPPFFTTGLLSPDKSRAGARHQATLTTEAIFRFCSKHLSSDGRLGLILPFEKIDQTIYEATLQRMYLRRLCTMSPRSGSKPIRAFFEFSPIDGPLLRQRIDIRTDDGSLNNEYLHLVNPFYTKIR